MLRTLVALACLASASASAANDIARPHVVSDGAGVISAIQLTPLDNKFKFLGQVYAENATVRVTWVRSDGTGKTLYLESEVDGRHTFEIMRVAANTPYTIKAFALKIDGSSELINQWDDMVAGRSIALPARPVGTEDSDDAWATITGTPTFSLLATDQAGYLTVFDETGAIVWYDSTCGGPKDQVDGNIVCLSSDGMGSSASLHEIDTDGNTIASASGSFNHEARVDPYDSANPVLTFMDETVDGFKSQKMGSWDRSTGTVTYPIDIFDYFSPTSDWGAMSSASDWTHANAAGTGNDNNYIMGIRHLSAIVSFDHDSLDKQWVLSSEIDSDFKFVAGVAASGYAEMYNMHDAQQTSAGTVICFDNGDSRPSAEGGTYSRGIEYELDFDAMTATAVWEFVTGEYSMHAGAISKMDNGNYIVSESCDGSITESCNMLTWEVDASGNEVAKVVTPKNGNNGSYRTEPWDSIGGEQELI